MRRDREDVIGEIVDADKDTRLLAQLMGKQSAKNWKEGRKREEL